jgi:hypothetical protein
MTICAPGSRGRGRISPTSARKDDIEVASWRIGTLAGHRRRRHLENPVFIGISCALNRLSDGLS